MLETRDGVAISAHGLAALVCGTEIFIYNIQ
jgi:hypothetical protein